MTVILSKLDSFRKKKAVKIVGICLLAAAFILYILVPVGFGIFASVRISRTVGDAPAGFKDISFTASDGVRLEAWYKPPQNGAVIVLMHGATGSREGIRSHAIMLAENGFGVLAFDLRGHGKSGGGANAFGWNGSKDVDAAVEFLKAQTDVKAIGGLGLSLGGEILLSSISARPELKAVVSEGAKYRCASDYLIIPSRRNLFYSWTTRVMYTTVKIITGDKPPVTMLDSISGAKGTKLLLIAADKEKDEKLYNRKFVEVADGRADLWIVPEAGHAEGLKKSPKEYEKRVVEFFKSELVK